MSSTILKVVLYCEVKIILYYAKPNVVPTLFHYHFILKFSYPLVLLFGPRPFDELWIENLLPPVLTLHICTILVCQRARTFVTIFVQWEVMNNMHVNHKTLLVLI